MTIVGCCELGCSWTFSCVLYFFVEGVARNGMNLLYTFDSPWKSILPVHASLTDCSFFMPEPGF